MQEQYWLCLSNGCTGCRVKRGETLFKQMRCNWSFHKTLIRNTVMPLWKFSLQKPSQAAPPQLCRRLWLQKFKSGFTISTSLIGLAKYYMHLHKINASNKKLQGLNTMNIKTFRVQGIRGTLATEWILPCSVVKEKWVRRHSLTDGALGAGSPLVALPSDHTHGAT